MVEEVSHYQKEPFQEEVEEEGVILLQQEEEVGVEVQKLQKVKFKRLLY